MRKRLVLILRGLGRSQFKVLECCLWVILSRVGQEAGMRQDGEM